MKPLRTGLLVALLATSVAAPLFAADSSSIDTSFRRTGVDTNATGTIKVTFSDKKRELSVQLAKLNPSAAFQIEVDGIVEATFSTSKKGDAKLLFRPSGSPALDFDPRGKTIRVLTGGVSVLETVVSGVGETAGSVVTESVRLALGSAPGATGSATAEYKLDKKGRSIFSISLANAGTGPFSLYVGGLLRGNFTVSGAKASLQLSGALLNFDPRGQVVDIVGPAGVVFSSELSASIPGINTATPSLGVAFLPATPSAGSGQAKAKLVIDDRARKHFSIELEGVPVGTYDFLVDGTDVGDIAVVTDGSSTKGELEFTSNDDSDEGELALTFDPVGRTLSVSQSVVVYFSGAFNPAAASSGGTNFGAATRIEEELRSTGIEAKAAAKADFRVDDKGRARFNIEIEDVTAGSYQLTIGGISRGTIQAVSVSGDVVGKIEFTSVSEAGKSALSFDPRGQLIEISSAAGVYFSHLFGGGTATGGSGGTVIPFDLRLPLLSSGLDADATAKASYRQKSSGALKLEIEAEDLPAGSYQIWIGGVQRGTLVVAAVTGGTEGKFTFAVGGDDTANAVLDFSVLDQDISIRQGETIYFSRVFAP
jgi:hypothetical protein